MRTFTTKVFSILVLALTVSLKPTYAQQDIKVPDVHDGTWLLLRTANYRITLPTSPTTETAFTIGTARTWQQIGHSLQVTEILPLQDSSQPFLTIWKEDQITYYALCVDKELKIGSQLNVCFKQSHLSGIMDSSFYQCCPGGTYYPMVDSPTCESNTRPSSACAIIFSTKTKKYLIKHRI